ncbi:DUF5658 family protein [Halomicroarcula sp. F13]|uniref:DUF5658 family protein n=1 Tax=Haloarcula rubra TaxID=2487747 RepID=A0AAW4PPM4_9EURY|nr:DUF5658 family protein [Halomicroarcula rubra]MBX0323140.1 DUF5658 family protein [Halomicroarcula rubra]
MASDFTTEVAFVEERGTNVERLLWGVVIVASAADVVLTLVGVSMCFSEANPVARAALDTAGGAGLMGLKLLALGALFVVYRRVRPAYRRAALTAFSLPQLFAVGHNSLLLVQYGPGCL